MKLLIVEDEPLLRQRLLRLCREIVGPAFSAAAVGSLGEAREQLRDRSFDGLLLDLNVAGHGRLWAAARSRCRSDACRRRVWPR